MEGAKLRLPLILVSLTTLSHGRHIDSKEALYTHTHQAYLQRGFTQDVRCLTRLGNNERVRSVTWLELGGLYPVQIARYVIPGLGTNYTRDHHYGLTETYSLVIEEARINDSGLYECRVTLRTGQALDPYEITITVVDTTFPENLDPQNITGFNLQRGQEHEFQCPLSSSDRSRNTTVYWCEDVDGETRITGVKFSDGEVLVNKNYLGGYDVTERGTLVVKELDGSRRRFLCLKSLQEPGIAAGLIEVNVTVTAKGAFPAISGCDPNEAACSVTVDKNSKSSNWVCSVFNVYPTLHLSWSIPVCDAQQRYPSFTISNISEVFDPAAQTFNQSIELLIYGNATFNCTTKCTASGLAIANSHIQKSLYFTSVGAANSAQGVGPAVPLVLCCVCLISLLTYPLWSMLSLG